MSIVTNLATIQNLIRTTALKSGRDPDSVKLLAVTKTVGTGEILQLVDNGHLLIGESRPQTLRDKAKELEGKGIHWHFIGTLQSNKIKYVYPLADLVHSIDSRDLIGHFAEWSRKTGRKCPALLEVHISEEEAKHGFATDEILDVIREIQGREDLDIRGLMGMAPFVPDRDIVRSSFRTLADLFRESKKYQGPGYRAEELSMGMSDDFPLAIEEGATIVRIGRALFEEVPETA